MRINLLFEHKDKACGFQNTLMNFRFTHPTFGEKIEVDEVIGEVTLYQQSTRVLYMHYESADNSESPVLSLADISHVLSSDRDSVCYDPVKALMSLEDILIFPGLDFYWCQLVSRKEKPSARNPNNCIYGSWIFHQYFDALNTEVVGVPLIAVKYVSTAEEAEDVPAGDKMLSRKKVIVAIEFQDSETGQRVACAFQSMMKDGTSLLTSLRFSSYVYPPDAIEFRMFLEAKYADTMKAWRIEQEGLEENHSE